MNTRRNILASVCTAIAFATGSVGATVASPNFSDIWATPGESGWGLNITQQADVLFATWFVYGPGNQPLWYTATLGMEPAAPDGTISFKGDLLQTTGPWFGAGTFNQALVNRQVVGTARFASRFVATATLTYTASGVTVTKPVERFTLRSNNLTGTYIGGISGTSFNCQTPGDNGETFYGPDELRVTHVGSSVTILTIDDCTMQAQYRQAGQMGYLDAGTFTCPGISGVATFAGYEVAVETTGFLLRYAMSGDVCNVRGNMGGARVN